VSTAIAGAQAEQIHLPFTGAPSGAATAFSSGHPHFVSDMVGHTGVSQLVRERLSVVSALWQPVLRNGVPIGVLTLAWGERVDEVSERVRSLVSLLAAEAAVAIERADLLARLEAVARTDDLTGLANRRAWDEHLPRELSRAQREARPLCVAMLDLDHFKDYNDERGHQAGDRLLKQVAATWREMLRPSDLLARYGGEEFGLLLPHCSLERGLEVVERLRTVTVAGQTCSAGVAAWDGDESPDILVSRADGALYEAKKAGRDRAVPAS
jgi:diguanylate cyclase (GGDEF)-like protein